MESCEQQLLLMRCPKGRQTEEGPEDACLNVNGMTEQPIHKEAASCSTSGVLHSPLTSALAGMIMTGGAVHKGTPSELPSVAAEEDYFLMIALRGAALIG